ncbi:hypothetical protein [Commensalibacter communis]|uniref:hypothetical protein n=1 Tax=Commensalibacter communis TaxID=2972786 RepID=UPI00232F911B|nr:hypothetical protein [Commensalibacter communis]
MTGFLVLIGVVYSIIGFAQAMPEKIIQGPFKTALYPNGKIYFTREDEDENAAVQTCHPISFFLEKNQNNLQQKDKIDFYEVDGECPEIKSVFFGNIHNKKYIFVMVIRNSNHPGAGMDGDFYQIYAYTKNKEGILSLDRIISGDGNLSGFDGGRDCKSYANPDGNDDCYVNYKYKTAADVKKYLKQKYH